MDRLRKAEATIAAVITVVAVLLHAVAAVSAGGLWRDEANTVGLATLPTLGDIWNNLQYDSFPLVWVLLVRVFAATFGAMNDEAFRAIGFTVGLLVIAVLWVNARTFGHRFPLVSLALFALSPSVIRWGDSFRAYGLGLALGLLTCGCLWRFVKSPNARNAFFVLISALLSVHTLYYNALVVLAFGAGAIAVFARKREWKNVFSVVAIGSIAAVSLLPYVVTIRGAASWNSLVQVQDYGILRFLHKFGETITPAGAWTVPVWFGAVIMALFAVWMEASGRHAARASIEDRELIVFAFTSLVVGLPAYFVFLRTLSYLTQPWYFVTLLAMIAACLEMISSALIRTPTARLIRVGAVVAVAIASVAYGVPALRERMTNVDLIAAELEGAARPGDLIVVSPWYTGVTFARYYNGAAQWTMLPAIGFHRFHRYDRLQLAMQEQDQRRPVQQIAESAGRALKQGHSVFLVGGLSHPSMANSEILPAARLPEDGWMSPRFERQWAWMLEEYLNAHATRFGLLSRDHALPVSGYENVPIAVATGWRE